MNKMLPAVARAMQNAVIRDDEGEFPRLFDLLGFSGENKAHTVVNTLARVAIETMEAAHTFPLGTRVTKLRGSSWTGRVCGTYNTSLTPDGYAVESENEPGSVQIYPAAALRAMGDDE